MRRDGGLEVRDLDDVLMILRLEIWSLVDEVCSLG